jgi:hypothetical protein
MPTTDTIRRAAIVGLASVVAGTLMTLTPAATATSSSGSIREAGAEAPAHARTDEPGSLTWAQRHVIREATWRFRDVDAAVAAGYVPTDVCEADPDLGGMGYHYGHPQLVADSVVDPTLPEVLVYAPDRHGNLRLAAIEYVKFDADGDLETDDDRPSLFGEPFDGPMEGHVPGQPVHYDIHAWVWKRNPAGELAQFNPDVTCPPGS